MPHDTSEGRKKGGNNGPFSGGNRSTYFPLKWGGGPLDGDQKRYGKGGWGENEDILQARRDKESVPSLHERAPVRKSAQRTGLTHSAKSQT